MTDEHEAPDHPVREEDDALVTAAIYIHTLEQRIAQLEGVIYRMASAGVLPMETPEAIHRAVPELATWPHIYIPDGDEEAYEQCLAELAAMLESYPTAEPGSREWRRIEVLLHLLAQADDEEIPVGVGDPLLDGGEDETAPEPT